MLTGKKLVLLPSPLLGPAVWGPVAAALAERGQPAAVVALPERATTPEQFLQGYFDALPGGEDIVLVPHSNAGLYLPAIAAARQVSGYIFVDAGLPAPDVKDVPLVLPAGHEFLRERADPNGVLPVWTEWWDEPDLAVLLPDARTRREVEWGQRRLPLSYFDATLPVPAGWDTRPGAYLAFGETYAAERDNAQRRGWPVTTLAGRHLHMLVDPEGVATAMIRIL